jgi:hypothetical protein
MTDEVDRSAGVGGYTWLVCILRLALVVGGGIGVGGLRCFLICIISFEISELRREATRGPIRLT